MRDLQSAAEFLCHLPLVYCDGLSAGLKMIIAATLECLK